MNEILQCCERLFDRSIQPFGIAQVHLDAAGNPTDVTIEYLNAAMAATADAATSDLRGKNIYEIWPDGDRAWLDFYYRAAYEDEAVEFETVSVEYRTFQHVSIFPIARGYCGYEVQDITSWMTHTHTALESVSAGMFFYEARTHLLLLTEPAQECCRMASGYLDVRDFADAFIDEATAQMVYDGIVNFSSECGQMLCEGQLKDGHWIRLSMSPGEATARFATGFLEDITLLKEVEEKSARRSEIIESLSAEYFALYLVNAKADTIVPYLLRNEVARFFAGLIGEDRSYAAWLERYCSDYIAEADRYSVRTRLSPSAVGVFLDERQDDFSLSCRRLYQGEEQYIELRLLRLSGTAGEVVLAARNINEEVKDQLDQKEALQTALTLAEHASEAKTTFLTNISHDFRTPLNSILGFSHRALDHVDQQDLVRNSLEKIIVSGDHLLELINDILDVSRIESGKVVLKEQPLDVVELMEDLQGVFSSQALEKSIDFSVRTEGVRDTRVLGDQLRINQILVNTVGNALKYTDAGGRVEVELTEGDVAPHGVAMFRIVVRDTGCGMSPAFVERIFMPFERDAASRARTEEGTGLGMTIAKNLIDLLGGTVKVTSELRKGSEFDITLPLKLDKEFHERAADAVPEEDVRTLRFEGFRALVVDDDELSREILGAILLDHGFIVEMAGDGDEAVQAVEDTAIGHYDVIIMDMRMPRMTGDGATRAIRALPRPDVKDLPIIAATADAFEEGQRRAREAGMTAHVTKPLDTRKLLLILRDCLRGRGHSGASLS